VADKFHISNKDKTLNRASVERLDTIKKKKKKKKITFYLGNELIGSKSQEAQPPFP